MLVQMLGPGFNQEPLDDEFRVGGVGASTTEKGETADARAALRSSAFILS